jgi:hypothetical protein
MDLDAATAIVCNPDAPVRQRVDALVRVVEGVSLADTAIPPRIANALDDPSVIDAAIAMRRTSSVCAALHHLGPAPELSSTRKRVVRRLVAAGAGGIELAGLAIDVGDVVPGANLALRDYESAIVPRLAGGPPDPVVSAWLAFLSDQPDTAAVAILRRLSTAGHDIDRLLTFSANPTHAARLATLARSIVAS